MTSVSRWRRAQISMYPRSARGTRWPTWTPAIGELAVPDPARKDWFRRGRVIGEPWSSTCRRSAWPSTMTIRIAVVSAGVAGPVEPELLRIVFDPTDPSVVARAVGEFAGAGAGLFVGPYLRAEGAPPARALQRPDGLLAGDQMAKKDRSTLATCLAAPDARAVEFRLARQGCGRGGQLRRHSRPRRCARPRPPRHQGRARRGGRPHLRMTGHRIDGQSPTRGSPEGGN
jgi:hypothetical protein